MLTVIQGHRQYHHSMERIRLPIQLSLSTSSVPEKARDGIYFYAAGIYPLVYDVHGQPVPVLHIGCDTCILPIRTSVWPSQS